MICRQNVLQLVLKVVGLRGIIKPSICAAFSGTTKVVPFPIPFVRPVINYDSFFFAKGTAYAAAGLCDGDDAAFR